MAEFDRGPTAALAEFFERVPTPSKPEAFWFDWGPVFYRGRLDGSARVLCLGSDPGPTERIAGRCLVGNAGQRVQGFLAKLGLTRSYVCLNAWAYAVHPSWAMGQQRRLEEPEELEWRNELYDRVTGPQLEAIIAFGGMARRAVELWESQPDVTVLEVPHPSSRDPKKLLDSWRAAVTQLRGIVTPDDDGDNGGPNYGSKFSEADYEAVPRRDLPFGMPDFMGDDSWVRTGNRGQNSVTRPTPDDNHTLMWRAPDTSA